MLVPTLPQALSIEESLLGALLMGTPYIHQVMQLSRDDDFYDQGLRNTFRAIVRLYNRGEEINAPLVYEELQRMLGPSEMYGDVLAARVMAMKSLVDGNRLRRKALAIVVIDYIQMLKITPATKDEVRAQTMDTDMHAFNKNSETGAVYAEEDIHMTYTGGMTFTLDKDPDAEIGYPDIDSDYDVEILGVSGRYDEFMYDGVTAVTKAALTQDGTITISKADGPNYTVALDSHTQTGKHLTASWTSPLAGYVWNYISGNEPVAIESVALQAEPSAPSCCRTIAS